MTVHELTKRELPALALLSYDPVTTLRFLGRDVRTIELPATERRFTIGSGACDVTLPRKLSPAISAVHASMERVGSGLLVRDLGSHNGIFGSLHGPRCETVLVHPGQTCWLADVAIRMTDRYLETLRSHLCCHLGILHDAAVDDALADIAGGEPLLLIGPPGTGARRLAAAIHATSPQRENPRLMGMAPPSLLRHAQGCTIFLDLDQLTMLSAPYLATLFDRAHGLRIILAASDDRIARARLDHYRERVRAITLVPLARRRDDIPHLLQFHWSTELSTRADVTALGPDALAALQAHDWPHNLDELYEHSRRLLAYHQHGGLRPAAAALGIKHQTLVGHFARIGFPLHAHIDCERPRPPQPAHTAAAAAR